MQFQADILERTVRRPAIRETTALGAAYLAGLAVGLWRDLDELRQLWICDTSFRPAMDPGRRASLLSGWHKAVGRSPGLGAMTTIFRAGHPRMAAPDFLYRARQETPPSHSAPRAGTFLY